MDIDISLDYTNYMSTADEKPSQQSVDGIISQNTSVDYCVAYLWKNRLIVGIIPKPLYSRSERTALEEQIKQSISEVYGFEEVLLSFDMDIIHEIGKLNKKASVDDKEAESLFYSVKARK